MGTFTEAGDQERETRTPYLIGVRVSVSPRESLQTLTERMTETNPLRDSELSPEQTQRGPAHRRRARQDL
jgi:hypothetical protein